MGISLSQVESLFSFHFFKVFWLASIQVLTIMEKQLKCTEDIEMHLLAPKLSILLLLLLLCIYIKCTFSNYIDSQLHCTHLWSYFAYKTVIFLLIYHHLHWFNNRFLVWFSSHILQVAWHQRTVVTEKLADVLRHLTKKGSHMIKKKKKTGLQNPEKNDLLCTTKHVHYATYEITDWMVPVSSYKEVQCNL